ncbi:MAG: LysR family transcriptional regulator [Azospirillaceae bacterium]|nr:LysR family transcriptional regulator [Azospirillaceae bacterium]
MHGPFDFNLRHLDATLAISQHGSLKAASDAVNLSQPALTQALAKLEKSLGVHLFERQASGTTLTAAGALFLPRVARAIERLRDAGRRLRRSMRLPPIQFFERVTSMGHLQALVAVEGTGGYVLAARTLGLAQPSVHRAVKELEATLGMPLLERAGRAMRPTPQGERLVVAIRLMASELQAGLDELATAARVGAARIRIGALPLSRSALLPDTLALFMRDHPQTDITIIEGPYEELLAALIGAEIDFIVGALRHPAPTSAIVQEPLFAEDLFIVARSGHPLAGSADATAAALATYPWIVGATGSPMRQRWDAIFADSAKPAVQIESSSILLARGLIIDGDWLALMSKDQFRIERATGLLAPVGGPVPGSRRLIGVTTRTDWLPTTAQAALIACLKQKAAVRSSVS